jgi:hypothetical protein
VEHPEQQGDGNAGEEMDERLQQRHRRNHVTQNSCQSGNEIRRHENGQQCHPE